MVSKAVAPTPGSKYRIKVGQTIGGLVWSNVAYTVDGKWQIIYDDGEPDIWPIVQSGSGSSRAAVLWTTGQIAKKNGWVIGGLVTGAPATAQRGQCFVNAFVLDANYNPASITDLLAMGYNYSSKQVEFGTFVEPGPAGGSGMFLEVQTADPAAANEIADQVVPVGAVRLLRLAQVQLVQGITQTPLPTLEFENASGLPYGSIPVTPAQIGASSTANLTWGIGLAQTSFTTVVGDEFHTAPLPIVYMTALQGPDRFATLTDGIGANTNYGVMTYQVEEWVMPN